ncbi:unnamed protein product [Ambrosiozyma monospora]|uniref:Unnamed protein product n=1 Tax=Ambrosiozyma monospora TaxID=43982 RepID=A0A9W6T8R1_AMBMO|nr:unnamed protein product [Ambrosiozyma monospora]GMG28499.1 unnamed protein product [Ambrosiozyma monospora]
MLQPEETQHEFFTDPINNYSSHWYVSTSNLSSDQFIGWGWSPVVPEGFGLAYMINSDFVHVNVTVFKNNQMGLTADSLAYFLTLAANELKEVLSLDAPVKAKL